ncbi:MAG: ZIP family metal transporter, partial [Fimbriimonadaceae bacterium]
GISLVEQISVTLLVAIFASNFPEALVGTIAMRSAGKTKRFAVGVWGTAALVLALFVVFGNAIGNTDENVLGFLLAFAGGAVLSSLADTLMPEAFEHGKPWNSFATAGGFFISFVLSQTV